MRLACDPRPTPMVPKVIRTKQAARRMANEYLRRQRLEGLGRICAEPVSTAFPDDTIAGLFYRFSGCQHLYPWLNRRNLLSVSLNGQDVTGPKEVIFGKPAGYLSELYLLRFARASSVTGPSFQDPESEAKSSAANRDILSRQGDERGETERAMRAARQGTERCVPGSDPSRERLAAADRA